MTHINEKVQKLFNIDVKSLDEQNRSVTFVFSDDSIDRMGEKVDQSSWDTRSYDSNPVILWGHDPSKPEYVIGSGSDLQLNQSGKSLITAQFDDDETGSLIFNKIKKGILRCVSAGFIPHTIDTEDDVPVLKDCELLEVSVVAIPANRNAVVLDYKAGGMSEKDAKYLIENMRSEADALEKQYTAPKATEKAMTDEQFQELMDAIKATNERIDTLSPPVETDEEKAAREAEEAKAAEEAEKARLEAEAANDDEHDQSGAVGDDIDLDAELTPELEEQLEQQLETAA